MKDYKKNMLLALGCFLVIVVLNFFLPRLLPGDPVAYLTGFAEEDMTEVAEIISMVIKDFEGNRSAAAERVQALCAKHPLYE